MLLPKQHEQYHHIVRDLGQQYKGAILKASVDYMKLLQREAKIRALLEERCKKLEQDNKEAFLKLKVQYHFL